VRKKYNHPAIRLILECKQQFLPPIFLAGHIHLTDGTMPQQAMRRRRWKFIVKRGKVFDLHFHNADDIHLTEIIM
jgi:hypothetical protein